MQRGQKLGYMFIRTFIQRINTNKGPLHGSIHKLLSEGTYHVCSSLLLLVLEIAIEGNDRHAPLPQNDQVTYQLLES